MQSLSFSAASASCHLQLRRRLKRSVICRRGCGKRGRWREKMNLEPYESLCATISNNVSIHPSYSVGEIKGRRVGHDVTLAKRCSRSSPAESFFSSPSLSLFLLLRVSLSPLSLCLPGSSRRRWQRRTEGIELPPIQSEAAGSFIFCRGLTYTRSSAFSKVQLC